MSIQLLNFFLHLACSEFIIIWNLNGPGESKQWEYCCENRNSYGFNETGRNMVHWIHLAEYKDK